jgi:tRNA G18 (ribose-2'-O)-methylase SpoU
VFSVEAIGDFEDPRLAPFRNMRAQIDHLGEGLFIAEGEKIVRRLVESPHPVVSVMLPPEWQAEYEPLLAARPERITLFVAPKSVLSQLTGFTLFQGVLGIGRVPDPIPQDRLLNELQSPKLFAAVDGVTNAVNVGLVIRNAAAMGVQALLVGETSAHPYLRRSVRSAMGSIFKLPYHTTDDLAATLRSLRQAGVRCLAAHPHTDRRFLFDADLTGDTCIVLGSEGDGIRPSVLSECDEAVAVPMQNGIDSLNVGNASAVFFYEAFRQRRRIFHLDQKEL